ncbi:MAG: VWA domain-containing protein, partial [Pyrinomonadaceae bacterium]
MRQKIVLIISILFISGFTVFAQKVPPPPPPLPIEDKEEIKIESRLVMIPVSVTDANGQAVTGLTAKDFRVLEQNKPQEIAEVGDAEKVPLEIALLFDVSASTDAMFKFEQQTAAKFLSNIMKPEDRATIFTIGENPLLVKGRDTAQNAGVSIKAIQSTKQYTAFYDTVRAAADYLNKNTPDGRRKVVVVISDGEDTNSVGIANALQSSYRSLGKSIDTIDRKSLYEFTVKKRNEANVKEQTKVLKSLQNADMVFYSINPAGSSYKLNKISQIGQANMEKFAGETGGTAFLPKFLPIDLKSEYENTANLRRNTETLEAIFQQLSNELRAQYLVQYYSDSEFPIGKYININIGVTNR